MKRIISVLLMMFFSFLLIFSLVGCNSLKKQDITFDYTYEILIDKELPDQSLVWAGKIEMPTRGVSIIELPEDEFNGIVFNDGIYDFKSYSGGVDCKEYSLNDVCKALNISKKELSKKFNMAIKAQDVCVWEDIVLYHFYVPEENQLDGNKVEFASKYVFIEYRGKEEAYMQAISAEEYHDAQNPFSIHSSNQGRIGDKFYLSNGYYDLAEHKYKLYENESDIPQYNGHKILLSNTQSLEVLKADAVLKEEIDESMYILSDIHIIKDRKYLIVGRDARYYNVVDNGRTYEGSELFVIMLDADTDEILYVAKYHSTNYNIGTNLGFYRINSEGMLCVPYLLD